MTKDQQIKQWIEDYSADLLNRAIYLISDKEEAKDLVQDVFLAACAGQQAFKGDSAAKTWLHSILKNKVADYYRKKYKAPSSISLDSYFDEDGNWRNGDKLLGTLDDGRSAEDLLVFDRILALCIEHLEAKWKILIKLYYLEEKKTPEICQEIGISTTNLWKSLQRARVQIRACLKTKEQDYE